MTRSLQRIQRDPYDGCYIAIFKDGQIFYFAGLPYQTNYFGRFHVYTGQQTSRHRDNTDIRIALTLIANDCMFHNGNATWWADLATIGRFSILKGPNVCYTQRGNMGSMIEDAEEKRRMIQSFVY